MRGSCTPFKSCDILNGRVLGLQKKVSEIWTQFVGTRPLDRDKVILEELGSWLNQAAWLDETGYYIRFRMHPLYSHQPATQMAARDVMSEFIKIFPNQKAVYKDNIDPLYANLEGVSWKDREPLGLNGTVTVVVHTDSYSIGD